MHLILHPGHAKCGSTTIQRFLYLNRYRLHREGILIPDKELRLPYDNHFDYESDTPRDFFETLIKLKNPELLNDRLYAIRNNPNFSKVIITAENLTNHIDGYGAFIHKALRTFFSRITIIYYIKPQDSLILSSWQQWGYKEGYSIENYIRYSLQKRNPNYLQIVRSLEEYYGKENIVIKPLVKDALYKNDLISDFLHEASISIDDLKFPKGEINKSLSPIICEILSNKKELFKNTHDERVRNKLSNITSNTPWLYTRFDEKMSVKLRLEIFNFFSEDNHYLHKNYFPLLNFEQIFLPKALASNQNGEAMSNEDLINQLVKENTVLRHLLAEIIAGIA